MKWLLLSWISNITQLMVIRFLRKKLLYDTYKHYVFCSPVRFNEISTKDRKTARYINEELGVVRFDCGVDILQAFLDNIPREAILIVNGHVKKQLLQSLLPQNRIVDLKVPFYSLISLRKCIFFLSPSVTLK